MHHLVALKEHMEVDSMDVCEEGTERSAPQTNNSSDDLFQGHPLAQRSDVFFRRSASTLSLVGVGVDPILTPATEAMPLAIAPQQLLPTSRRSELFGTTMLVDN